MKSEISILTDIVNEGLPVLEKYVGEGACQELAAFVAKRSTDATPTVMVFGIYNAGKSTLLNALIGEERASMADRPETSTVTSYSWNGFNILDTPGIDAPIEHEDVTRKQLSESDIVLFVLSTNGSFDEKAIYDEVLEVLRDRKPVMMIVNNKDGYGENDPEFLAIQDKIIANLAQAASASNMEAIECTVPVRLVNAKLALKGKLSKNPKLIKASGVELLSQEIEALLHQSGIHEVINTLGGRITKLVDIGISKVALLEDSDEAKELAEQQSLVRGEKERITTAVSSAIRRASLTFRTSYHAAIESNDTIAMENAAQNAVEAITLVLEREIEATGKVLESIGASLEKAKPIRIAATVGAAPYLEDLPNEESGPSLADPLLNTIGDIASRAGKESVEGATKEAARVALKTTKDIAPRLLKGVGPKGMEKMAESLGRAGGKMTPFIGPAIDAVRGIYDYYKVSKAHDALVEAKKRRTQVLNDHAEQTTANLEAELRDSCRAIISPLFIPIEESLKSQAKELGREVQAYVTDRQVLELMKLRVETTLSLPNT